MRVKEDMFLAVQETKNKLLHINVITIRPFVYNNNLNVLPKNSLM